MPLGVAERVDDSTIGRAITRAQQATAIAVLAIGVVVLLVMQVERPEHWFWALALALVPMIVLLFARLSSPSELLSAAYLVFGGIAIYTIDLSRRELTTGELAEAGVGFFVVRLALILCGSASPTVAAGILWTALGYLTGEGAALAASITLGVSYQFSVPMLLAAIAIGMLRPISGLVSPKLRTVWQQLRQASIDDEAARHREIIEQRAAALVHDTVLGQLHAIATAPDGELGPELRTRLTRTVNTIDGEDWLELAHEHKDSARAEWQQTPLFAALQDARLLGLTVDVTGDPTALSRVAPDTSLALGLATAQCLTNVLKHSGVTAAEVAIYGTDRDVCVMVIDAGQGFDVTTTAADRLGLSASVTRRIETVGGRVNVWSTPGQGTSIMLRVPDRQHPSTSDGGPQDA